MTRTERIERLRRLLGACERSTVGALAEGLKVSERTILRDLAYLREQGVAIEGEAGAGGGVQLRYDRGVTAVHMTFDEIVALWIAASLTRQGTALPWGGATRSALDKLLSSVPPQRARELRAFLRCVVIGPPASAATAAGAGQPSEKLLPCVESALRKRQRIRMEYLDRNAQVTQREVEPHGLLLQPPVWYLLAMDTAKQVPRMFRMDRIRNARLRPDQTFLPRADVILALTQDLPPSSADR